MIFGEIFYATFLILSLFIYWTVDSKLRVAVIAASGVAFYAYYANYWVLLLVGITLVSWATLLWSPLQVAVGNGTAASSAPLQNNCHSNALAIAFHEKTQSDFSQRLALATIPIFICILGYFKYGGFIRSIFTGGEVQPVIVPLAISFFTFEFIHVAYEKYKGNLEKVSLLDYFSFIFFFPTMIAGPIKRYGQFSQQLEAATLTAKDFLEGLFRIILGLAKKVVIADNLNTYIQEIGSPEKTQNPVLLSGAIFLYGFRIYMDFSGYSDIAIGSARLFGIKVPENFNYPYLQTNITAFWRHWHISLYTWLVDYVYIPLGGSRAGFSRALLNVLITMVISGIWHGAAWNFILWGLWHGILLVIHKIYTDSVKPNIKPDVLQGKYYQLLSYLLTMAAVWFGWCLFMWPLADVSRYLQLLVRAVT